MKHELFTVCKETARCSVNPSTLAAIPLHGNKKYGNGKYAMEIPHHLLPSISFQLG